MRSPRSRRAFTLIELLVVIAVIAILAGISAVALRGGDRGTALQAAQSSLSSLVSSARAQAAVSLNDATIVIWGDDSKPDTFLRRAAILTRDRDTDGDGDIDGNDGYIRRGGIVDLPRGVYFVPPDLGSSLPAKYEKAADWPTTNYRTQSADNPPATLNVQRPDGAGGFENDTDFSAPFKAYRTITINPQGLMANNNTVLVIALGEAQNGGVLFSDSDSQRGLILSNYGIPTVINEKAGLKQ